MQHGIWRVILLFVLWLLLEAPSKCWAGWHYDEKTTHYFGKQRVLSQEKAVVYWQGMKFRRENSDGTIEILRLDQNLYWELDPGNKTYRKFHLVPVAEGDNPLPRELDEALAQLSDEERQLLQKYLPSRAASEKADRIKVSISPGVQTIGGYECQKVQARYRNFLSTLWVTTQLTMAPEDLAFYRELAKRTMHREGLEDWYVWAETLSQTGGFAIKKQNVLESAAGSVKTEVLVENLVQKNLAEEIFQLPAGLSMQDE